MEFPLSKLFTLFILYWKQNTNVWSWTITGLQNGKQKQSRNKISLVSQPQIDVNCLRNLRQFFFTGSFWGWSASVEKLIFEIKKIWSTINHEKMIRLVENLSRYNENLWSDENRKVYKNTTYCNMSRFRLPIVKPWHKDFEKCLTYPLLSLWNQIVHQSCRLWQTWHNFLTIQ